MDHLHTTVQGPMTPTGTLNNKIIPKGSAEKYFGIHLDKIIT